MIAALKEAAPELDVYACGGPLMEAAGATLLANTAEDGAMGTAAWSRVLAVRRQIKDLKRWSASRRVVLHVPVDSPAANFPLCKVLRRQGVRTIHLVAPQLWAWGAWRVKKLRRRTDLVLCLLPFEEQWFNDRAIPAQFIGHPAIDRNLDAEELAHQAESLPAGRPRLALFPGSRSHEIRANGPLLASAFAELKSRFSNMSGVIVAANPNCAQQIRRTLKVFPNGLHMLTGQADAVIAWSDLALTVSGTMTLHIARHQKPMIGVYSTGVIAWLGAKLILRTRYRLLPNIIAEREIVPEFVPYIGGAAPIVAEAIRFLNDSHQAAILSEQLRRVCLRFANKEPAREAAQHIVSMVRQ